MGMKSGEKRKLKPILKILKLLLLPERQFLMTLKFMKFAKKNPEMDEEFFKSLKVENLRRAQRPRVAGWKKSHAKKG